MTDRSPGERNICLDMFPGNNGFLFGGGGGDGLNDGGEEGQEAPLCFNIAKWQGVFSKIHIDKEVIMSQLLQQQLVLV